MLSIHEKELWIFDTTRTYLNQLQLICKRNKSWGSTPVQPMNIFSSVRDDKNLPIFQHKMMLSISCCTLWTCGRLRVASQEWQFKRDESRMTIKSDKSRVTIPDMKKLIFVHKPIFRIKKCPLIAKLSPSWAEIALISSNTPTPTHPDAVRSNSPSARDELKCA